MGKVNKPEELVKAMEALKEACSSIHPEFAENPHGEKPTGLGKQKNAVYDVMKGVYAAMEGITNYLATIGFKETEERVSKLEEDVKDLESDKDALVQKRKVGTIILQSNRRGKNPMLKQEKEVKEEELGAHASYLIKEKTGVTISADEISKLHFVPGGGLKVRFKEVHRGSKFQEVVAAIKRPSAEQRDLNLFANFELTKTRSSLLFEVRKAKKENRLAKYFVDFDGTIEVQLSLEDKERVRLTRQSEVMKPRGGIFNSKQPDRTFTTEAFRQLLINKSTR